MNKLGDGLFSVIFYYTRVSIFLGIATFSTVLCALSLIRFFLLSQICNWHEVKKFNNLSALNGVLCNLLAKMLKKFYEI